MESDRLELLAKIASLYFEEGLGQAEIAARTGYSRSMVSRLLTDARAQGVVEIRVNHPIERRQDLELALQTLLGLKIVRVLVGANLDYEQMLPRLGRLAALLLQELLHDDITIGVSWGTAVHATALALRPGTCSGAEVIQLIGSLGTPDPEIDGAELTRRIARTLMGRYTILPAPLFVDSEATRQSLVNDSRVQQVTAQFRTVEIALVGVGTIDPERSSLMRSGYLTARQLEELRRFGAVGDVCAIQFDATGRLIDAPLTRREIGIEPDVLAQIPMKLGVAGGPTKVVPIIGASRAGLINMLATDDVAATQIVQRLRGMENRNGNES